MEPARSLVALVHSALAGGSFFDWQVQEAAWPEGGRKERSAAA